jgi:hypothetical protein
LRVLAGDLRVPGKNDVVVGGPADADALVRGERHDAQLSGSLAIGDERPALALGRQQRGQFRRRQRVRREPHVRD